VSKRALAIIARRPSSLGMPLRLVLPSAASANIVSIRDSNPTAGELYTDLGGDYFTRQNPDRTTKRLIRQLEALGHRVTLEPREVPPDVDFASVVMAASPPAGE
jgi:hypothetical protein